MFKVRKMKVQLVRVCLPNSILIPKTYAFRKRKFGSKGKKQSCRAAWFDKCDWLYYNATVDSAMSSEQRRPWPPNYFRLLFLVLCTCATCPCATDLGHRVPRRSSEVA